MVKKMLTYLGYDLCAMNRSLMDAGSLQSCPACIRLSPDQQMVPELTVNQVRHEFRQFNPDTSIIIHGR